MGRGRGKGKKLTVVSHEDSGSGEEEKIPVQKRRGRPQKPMKDDIDEEQIERIEEDEIDIKGTSLPSREVGRVKRKRNAQASSTPTPVKEENSNDADKPNAGDSTKPNEIRNSGSRRRKSTPHRAAEAEVKGCLLPAFSNFDGRAYLPGCLLIRVAFSASDLPSQAPLRGYWPMVGEMPRRQDGSRFWETLRYLLLKF